MTAEASTRTYRHIPFLSGACTECDEVHPLTQHHKQPSYINKYGVRQKAYLMPVHGPRNDRCLGGHTEPKPWLEASGLPAWDELSDLDKGAALMFVWKCYWEHSYGYAVDNYPARYVNHPLLVAFNVDDTEQRREACRHASVAAGTWGEANDRLGEAEVTRLYNLALEHEETSA